MKYALEQESILGVDTHLDVHVAAVINQSGQLLGTQSVSTNTAGYFQLFQWASAFGALKRAGVEGTGTYGAGLCRFLCDKGIMVLEVNRPDRANRRLNGKSDSLDAENAARSVLSGVSKAIPKQQSGAREAWWFHPAGEPASDQRSGAWIRSHTAHLPSPDPDVSDH